MHHDPLKIFSHFPHGSPNSAAPSQVAKKPIFLSPEELQNMPLGPILTQPMKFIKFNAPFEDEKINYFKITNASTNRIGLKIDLSCPDRIQTDVNVCCLDVNGSIKIRIVTKRFDLDKNAQDCIAITWMNVQNEGDIDEEFFEGDGLRNKKKLFLLITTYR
ncbi:hypothetical protein CRE_00023 [Caenorhabditis remanei]|uniref:Major sperm protein n=1 Tax=Caenorhabditis remanei TaxID=31234 RepID=E3LCD1_CAERE|nr:hypothetical protein CRE_00023 [Caenorhabditis remanei]